MLSVDASLARKAQRTPPFSSSPLLPPGGGSGLASRHLKKQADWPTGRPPNAGVGDLAETPRATDLQTRREPLRRERRAAPDPPPPPPQKRGAYLQVAAFVLKVLQPLVVQLLVVGHGGRQGARPRFVLFSPSSFSRTRPGPSSRFYCRVFVPRLPSAPRRSGHLTSSRLA